jgi:DNA-binding transcriptional LysR family regulator
MQRSTRALSLTREGADFYEQVAPAIRALKEAEANLGQPDKPRGVVRLSAPIDMSRMLIASWLGEFTGRYPNLHLDLNVTDRFVDLWREPYDLAIRLGAIEASTLTCRRLGSMDYAIVASPGYLDVRGRPSSIEDLSGHSCLRFRAFEGRPLAWSFEDAQELVPDGPFTTDDGGALLTAAKGGAGLAYMFRFAVEAELAAGSLVEALSNLPKPRVPVFALHAFGPRLPARVRTFVDFIEQRLREA